MIVAAGVLIVWLLASAAYRLLSMRAMDRRLSDPDSDGPLVPPSGEIVAFRPLKGGHPWLETCLESLWAAAATTQTRVVLGVADPGDPAVAEIRRLMREDGGRPLTQLRIRPGPPGTNRKMANLMQMTDGTLADLLAFSDADVEVPVDYLDRAARPFKDSDVGLVTFPYRSVPARSLSSRVDALITNTQFLPSVAMALEVQGLHFGLGASLVVRREALEKAGGLESLLEVAGDDYWMARHIETAGYRLEFVPLMLKHRLEDEGWRGSLRRHLRWSSVVREQRPLGYFGQITLHGFVPALALGVLGVFSGPFGTGALALPLAWWAAEARGLWKRRDVLGLGKRDLALLPLVGLAGFGVWAAGFFGRPRPS